ncbi:helicase-related protein [Halosegnis rubeus]|uniref:DEAD/DEAH box helicase n=1 Tax=Halosegnis rubeus TaxID=2212850 RepID=A0A5N5UK12_9EURY|nr:helicase-related protein [Halosegnis rubeus]KAB7518811.1 DEAD/DEAH box helicase [Halosegnis rubeus]
MTLKNVSWKPVYESRYDADQSLMETFYRPFLGELVRYDRLAGYLSLRSLAVALEGVDSMLETDGTVRIIAGADLQKREKGAFFPDADAPLEPWVESQLTIIGTLVERGDLTIKVGEPQTGSGLFHPKLGIGVDRKGNKVSFEGSINETVSAWQRNYERFKLHRLWKDGERKYVQEDLNTFDELWNDHHPSVNVYELDEAARQEIINWTDTDESLETHVQRVRERAHERTLSEVDNAAVVKHAGRSPGGLHHAEEISTIDPWPHQRTIADTAVSIFPNNALFCDEVGLGKTIEAGLTLSRLMQTGQVQNALFLVPAGLVQQWQEELVDRFNIHAYRHERTYQGDFLVGPIGGPDDHRVAVDGRQGAHEWAETPIGQFVTERDHPTVIIQSWHTARREDNQQHVAPHGDDPVWDLTVVDEAHSAREGTKLYGLLGDVEAASRAMYALTATPMQLNIGELYDLLRLCDLSDGWDDKERFTHFFETRQALEAALEQAGDGYGTLGHGRQQILLRFRDELGLAEGEGKPRIQQFGQLIHEQLTANPGYGERPAELVDETDTNSMQEKKALEKLLGVRELSDRFDNPRSLMFDCGPAGWAALVEAAEWATPVQSRIFRNTRSVLEQCKELELLEDTVPTRDVETKRIDLGEAKPLYEQVETYIDETYKQSQKALTGNEKLALGFVMTTYRQRLTSSLYAVRQSLIRRLDKLDEEVADMTEAVSELGRDSGVTEAAIDDVLGGETIDAYRPQGSHAANVIQSEREALQEFVEDLERARADPKISQLSRDIRELRSVGKDDIIIFTQYQDTLEHIRRTLTDTHPNVGTYSGGGGMRYNDATDSWEDVGKEAIKRDFTDGETNILICTDSASEGLNLQTAHALINFDLPWNPMRVEQRIGRIDRIGQENEVVKIINYGYKDSIDGDIYEELEGRLELFENVVGPMRPVLNSIEKDITEAVMGGASGDATEQVLSGAQQQADEAKERAEQTGLESNQPAATREAIIKNAGLDGWAGVCHPAIESIGWGDRAFDPIITHQTIETVLTQSEQLQAVGWAFTALRNHDRADAYEDVVDEAYVLEGPNPAALAVPEAIEETAQAALRSGDGVVVTFTPAIAEEYPSIRCVLPGDPLFNVLIDIIAGDPPELVTFVQGRAVSGAAEISSSTEPEPSGEAPVVLPASTKDGVTNLLGEGSITDVATAERTISDWISRL